jgi:addiction module HigA family antidote
MILSPGETILREMLEPLNISVTELAQATGMLLSELNSILKTESPISPEAAVRLEAVLGESAESLLALQAAYDIARARESADVAGLARIDVGPRQKLAKGELQKLFDHHSEAHTPVDMIAIHKIGIKLDQQTLFSLMLEIDPNRSIFNPPIGQHEVGLHGLPLLKNRFRICSDAKGALNEGETEIPVVWRDAAGLYTRDLRLNASIRLAWDNEVSQYCFLQLMLVDPRAVPVTVDMAKLAEEFGAKVDAFATPAAGDTPAKIFLVGFDYSPTFKALDDMAWDQIGVKQRWAIGL